MSPKNILDLPMDENDAAAKTIRGYLKALLSHLWEAEESFSGKRPFGNSGWQHDVYRALAKGKAIEASLDEDGYLESFDREEADKLIHDAIAALR